MKTKTLTLLQELSVSIALLTFIFNTNSGCAQVCDKNYICYKSTDAINIDGDLNDYDWQQISWSESFVNILGESFPSAENKSRFKLLYNSQYLYIGAEIQDSNIWAKQTIGSGQLYNDNAFEVFIDPSGTTHNYLEFQVNALGTKASLKLDMPYRDGKANLQTWANDKVLCKVKVYGTINNPTDIDSSWTIEMAIPWESVIEYSSLKNIPERGDIFRINLAAVRWKVESIDGQIKKKTQNNSRIPQPPEYDVWAPQYEVNLHKPEFWGYVKFSDYNIESQIDTFICRPEENIKWFLREVYYYQSSFFEEHQQFSKHIQEEIILGLQKKYGMYSLITEMSDKKYKAIIHDKDYVEWSINHEGKIEYKPLKK